MDSFNNLREFNLHIEDVSITVVCDNPPDEIETIEHQSPDDLSDLTPTHNHAHYELFNVKQGTCTLYFENESITFPENSVIIVSPMVFHASAKSSEAIVETICFYFKQNKQISDFPLYWPVANILTAPYFAASVCPKLTSLMHELHFNIKTGNYPEISFLFHRFILKLYDYNNDKSLHSVTPATDSNMKRLYKIQQTLGRDFSEDIKLEAVAEKLFLSSRQLNRIIKTHFGCTFKEYLIKMRMSVASELLLTTDLPVTEIFDKAGYNSLQSFYIAFKKNFGCTPVEFRKKNQKNMRGCSKIKARK